MHPTSGVLETLPPVPARRRLSRLRQEVRRASTVLSGSRWQLLLALAFAVAVRLFVVIRAHGMMDGDEAVLGIQAENILRGSHPIYFYGQAYMGSWDAYLAAPLIAIFGPHAWVLHAVTLAESLLLVPLLGALAKKLYGERAGLPAMMLAAFPPLYVTQGELRMLGGYVETLVLGTALMLLTVTIAQRWHGGTATGRLWVLVGLLTGLAFWIDPLIACYGAACALWMLPVAIKRIRGSASEGLAFWRGTALNAAGCLIGTVIGMAPAIGYGLRNRFINISGLLTSDLPRTARIHLLPYVADPLRRPVAAYYFLVAMPFNAGVSMPWDLHWAAGWCAVLVGLLVGGIAIVALSHALLRLISRNRKPQSTWAHGSVATPYAWWNAAFPLLLLLTVSAFFWRSSVTASLIALQYWAANARYALPLSTASSLLLASLWADVGTRLHHPARGVQRAGWRARLRASGASWLAAALLLAFAVPYVAVDGSDAMQSPYASTLTFPAAHAEILGYLEQHHIQYVWTNHWIGNVVMYLADERVLCADYYDVVHGEGGRFPHTAQLVAAADRPSFIVIADTPHGKPREARMLDALQVSYESAQFGSLWVITPVSRTVAPRELQLDLTISP
jgi:hypothetical protein